MRWANLLLAAMTGWEAHAAPSQAVALLIEGHGAAILRKGDALPLPAPDGELLFAGDVLTSGSRDSQLLYCPAGEYLAVAPGGAITVGTDKITGRFRKLRTSSVCVLPKLDRDVSDAYALTRSTAAESFPQLTAQQQADYARESSRIAALPGTDIATLIAKAELDARFGFRKSASEIYRRISQSAPEAGWPRELIHDLAAHEPQIEVSVTVARHRTSPPPADFAHGATYALIVGISQYQRLPPELQLHFARADAELFERHLLSPRGGSIPAANIVTLLDSSATTAAIRNAIHTFLRVKAGRNDTVIVFVAAHGQGDHEVGYIVTHDSDPEDLRTTAFPMNEMQKLMEDELAHVGRVELYIDVCHAGTIGTIRHNRVNESAAELLQVREDTEVIGLLSSGPREVSYESARFGGGHGAFSYFLLYGLAGHADADKDGVITVDELIRFVKSGVAEATRKRQNPSEEGYFFPPSRLVEDFASKSGIQLAVWTPLANPDRPPPPIRDKTTSDARRSAPPDIPQAAEFLRLHADAEYDSAWAALKAIQATLSVDLYRDLEDRLRVAVQDAAQAILLRYISGEQTPQRKEDFEKAARLFQLALALDPGTIPLESKAEFSIGRALIFDHRYAEAQQHLLRSIRLNPAGAYSYNALGIALIEQSRFEDGAKAFRDASRRAPHWAYPLHNLALAENELGNAEETIQAYRKAMQLAPGHFYIPYNLALVYQKLNQRPEAEAALRKALALGPNEPEIFNSLGVLKASGGDRSQAESSYRKAIALNADFLPARHNLALLLSSDRARLAEALDIWRQLLAAHPDYLPARVSVADVFTANGRSAEAIDAYKAVLAIQPEFQSARLTEVRLLVEAKRIDEARAELAPLVASHGRNPRVLEAIGDVALAAGRKDEALGAYRDAMDAAADPEVRGRLKKKVKEVRSTPKLP